jgi:hypothetical protein
VRQSPCPSDVASQARTDSGLYDDVGHWMRNSLGSVDKHSVYLQAFAGETTLKAIGLV